MEVLSTQKRARSSLTLAATTVLMVIAVLQSFQMVHQKTHRWRVLLDSPLEVGTQIHLRVPEQWHEMPTSDPIMSFLRGQLASLPGTFEFRVIRDPRRRVMSPNDVYPDVLYLNEAVRPLIPLPAMTCRLGNVEAAMRGFEWISDSGEHVVLRAIAAADGARGTTVLTLKVLDGSDQDARGLLRQIAASAVFEIPIGQVDGGAS